MNIMSVAEWMAQGNPASTYQDYYDAAYEAEYANLPPGRSPEAIGRDLGIVTVWLVAAYLIWKRV